MTEINRHDVFSQELTKLVDGHIMKAYEILSETYPGHEAYMIIVGPKDSNTITTGLRAIDVEVFRSLLREDR